MKQLVGCLVVLVCSFGFAGGLCGGRPQRPLKALIVTGQSNHNWRLSTPIVMSILKDTGLFDVDIAISPDEGGDGYNMEDFKPDFAAYDVVVLNVRDTDRILISAKYSSQNITVAIEETPKILPDLSKAIVYPNPIRPHENHTGKVIFANLPGDTSIFIYNITGTLIEQLKVEDADRGKKEWFILNNAASEIASGVYVYVLEANGQRKSGKLAILR